MKLLLIIFFIFLANVVEASGRCRHSFKLDDNLTLSEARKVYKRSVANLVYKSTKLNHLGTTFLIDDELGLYLTAKHVIKGFDKGEVLLAIHGEYPSYKEIPVVILHSTTSHDLALLQAQDQSLIPPSYTPFGNVNFKEAVEGDKDLYAFGRGPVDGERELRSDSATFSNWTKNNTLMQVNTTIVSGDSGGPLIDKYGQVTGVYKAKTGRGVATTGEFTPSIFFDEVLIDLKPNKTVVEVSSKLALNEYSEYEFAEDISRLTNLELLMLSGIIEEDSSTFVDVSKLISCPLNTALYDRDMGHVAHKIANYLTRVESGRALILSVNSRGAFNNPNSKVGVLSDAISLLEESLIDAEKKGLNGDYMGYLALDIANAQYSKAQLLDGKEKELALVESINNFVKAGGYSQKLQKLTYAMSGNAFSGLQKPELASRSYLTSENIAIKDNSKVIKWLPGSLALSLNNAKCSGDCASNLKLISEKELSQAALAVSKGNNYQ